MYGQEAGSKRGGSDFVNGDRHDTAACVSAGMKPSEDENAPERSEQRASLQAGRGWENSSSLGTVWFKRHFGYSWGHWWYRQCPWELSAGPPGTAWGSGRRCKDAHGSGKSSGWGKMGVT